jgi:WD40 repeat protein
MTSCCAIRTRRVCVVFSRRRLSLICLGQSYLRRPTVLSRPGVPTRHPYLTPLLSVPTLTTSGVSPTGNTQVQLLTLFIYAFRASREQGWVASGSFDRTIKLWDFSRASRVAASPPLTTLTPPETPGSKTSIYALAVDPQGHTIVSGGPERVVRMWDPRAGKRIGKLVGHTDNIRAVLLSEDARCVRCCTSLPNLRSHFLPYSSLPPLLMVCRLPS